MSEKNTIQGTDVHGADFPAEDTVKLEEPRWELTRVVRGFLSRLRWGVRLLIFGGCVLLLAQIAVLYRTLADLHPWLGVAGVLVFVVLLGWLVGRPLAGALRLPRVVTPPRMPAAPQRTAAHGRRQLQYLERYLRAQQKNPALSGQKEKLQVSLRALAALRQEARALDDARELSARITHLEREHVLPLLEPLDRRAETLIHREALAIGSMTALSPNGTLDAFLVLWRNANLVAALARLYYGRPGLVGTWLILRDVSSAILLSSVLEQISDMGGSLLRKLGEGGRTIPLVGALVGPVLDGTINGLMTMKVGYLAQERCRSFRAWDGRTKRGIIRRTFHLVSDSAALFMEELNKSVVQSLNLVKFTAEAGKGAAQTVSSKALALWRSIRRAVGPQPSWDSES
jgi:uncharacterized membrane protein YcjF (UPF0283 family)